MKSNTHPQGMVLTRLFMVLSSISPLFILWAIRGSKLIFDGYFISGCVILIVFPNALLAWRIYIARKREDKRILSIGRTEDHRNHLLIYLFALLLPIYSITLDTWRDFSVAVVSLVFIVFLFFHLNLHYMNLVFAILGYRVFTIYPSSSVNPYSGKETHVLITKRAYLENGQQLNAYRLSNNVYLEVGE